MSERRYDEKEVAQILSKAATSQAGFDAFSSGNGVTLEELVRVAEEIGMSRVHVQQAAIALDGQRQERSGSDSSSVLLTQSFDGTLSEEVWDQLITEVQSFSGRAGSVIETESGREWRGGSDLQSIVMTTRQRDGRTQLKVLGEASGTISMIVTACFGIGMFLSFGPLIYAVKHASSSNTLLTLLMTVMVVFLAISVSKAIVRSQRRKFHSQVRGLMDQLEMLAAAKTATGLQESRLEIPAEETRVVKLT
jgi:hypothetical protein